MRKLARLLPFLAILGLIAVAAFVLLRAGPLAEHVRKVVQTELGQQLGRPVSIGSAALTVTGGVVLGDVVIRNKDGSVLLKAPVMQARVGSTTSLLRGGAKNIQVRSVHLERPELNVARRADGTWSVSDLIGRTGKGPSRFRGGVTADDARITLVDETRGGLTTSIEKADITFKQPAEGRLEFRVRAGANEGRFEGLDLRGKSDTKTKVTELRGQATRLNLPFALERIPGLTALTAGGGAADVKGELLFNGDPANRELSYDVAAEVSEAEVSFPWLRRPVKGVAGKLRIQDGDLRLESMTGTVEDAPVELRGTITDLLHPQFGLDLSVTGIRYPQLRALFPRVALPMGLLLPSPMRVTAKIEGPAGQVKVSGEARVKVIKFHLIPWHDLVGRFEYQDDRLKITKLRGHGSPRQFEAEIEIDLKHGGPRARGSVALMNMPLSMLAEMAGVEGEFRGLAQANVRGATADGGELRGDFTVEGAAVQGVDFGRLAGEFVYRDGGVKLRRVRITGPTAHGTLTADISLSGSYSLEAQLASLDLTKLGPMLKIRGLHGRCCARVGAYGRVEAGRVNASVRLGPGELQGRPFDTIAANLKITREQVTILDLEARAGRAQCHGGLAVSGWRLPAERAKVSGRLDVAGVALEDWAAPGRAALAAKGVVTGAVQLSGTRASPAILAELRGESVVIAGQALATARARLRYERGRFVVEQVDLRTADRGLAVTGGYTPAAGFAIEVTGKQVDLGAMSALFPGLAQRFGLSLAGRLDVAAEVTGPLERPLIEFSSVRAAPLSVNGQWLDEFSASGRLVDGAAQLEASALRWKDSRISLSGEVDTKSRVMELSAELKKVDLGLLLRVGDSAAWRVYQARRLYASEEPYPFFESAFFKRYAKIPRPLSGSLSGEVLCSGSFAEPELEAKLDLADVGFDGGRIEHISGGIAVAFGVDASQQIAVRQGKVALKASHELSEASVNGEVTRDGRVSLDVETGNLNLNLLNPWLDLPVELGGQAKIDFAITGTLKRPVVRGSVFLEDLRLGPFPLEAAGASAIELKQDARGWDVLDIEDIWLRNGAMEATGNATIPVNKTLAAVFSTANLQVLNATFAPVQGMLPAEFDAGLHLEGATLHLQGDDGAGGPAPGIRGKMGSGSFSVSGEVGLGRLSGGHWQPVFHVMAELDKAQVSIPELFDVKVTGTVALGNGAAGQALLTTDQGEPPRQQPLVISDGTVSFEQTRAIRSRLGGLFAPELKVRLAVGDNVWFRRGSEQRPTKMRIDPARTAEDGTPIGYLDIGGTMKAAEVTLAGEFESHEGQLAFPNGVLTLRTGTAWVTRKPGEKPVVTVSAEAEGMVGDYLVSLNPSGQIYPSQSAEGEVSAPPLALNLGSAPRLEEAYVMALLKGPVVAPTRGESPDLATLLADPTRAGGSGGEITGIRLPPFGDALGMQEFSLDVALQGPVRLRLGQRILKRLVVSYVGTLSGPVESRTLRFNYEVTPRYSIGYGVNELNQGRWEANAFIPF